MLDVKKLIAKMLNKMDDIGKYGTKTTVTLPFTAQSDGIAIAICAVPTSSASYLYIAEDGLANARGCSTSGLSYSVCFPVKKGKTYTASAKSNSNPTIYLYPFMGGGNT